MDLGGKDEIADMLLYEYDGRSNPDVPELERVLERIHARLTKEARERGWEPKQ